MEGLGKCLVYGYFYLEVEVVYCVCYEYCEFVVDFIVRRVCIVFLDMNVVMRVLLWVVEILVVEYGWDRYKKKVELEDVKVFLEIFKFV